MSGGYSTSSPDFVAGLVFPDEILTQPWFAVFGLFVAFNTIIYLGLTASKFIPWPAPVHPRTVRQVIPLTLDKDSPMRRRLIPYLPSERDPEVVLRESTARETIPLALGLTGAITVLAGFINTLLYLDLHGPLILLGPALGFLFIIISQVIMRRNAGERVMIWTWVILMVILVSETSWRAEVVDSAVVLSYAVIALMIIAPITLSWGAGITGAIAGLIPIIVSGYSVSLVNTVSWILAAFTAGLASLVLLRLRLTGIHQIALAQRRATTLASTDTLTGVFSRTGLLALAPSIATAAEKSQDQVTVIVCDVKDMTIVNADYGITYGDDVLEATARALRATLPDDALVGRWDGDQFVALSLDDVGDSSTLTSSVDAALADSGIALGKRPVRVRIGMASASPTVTTLEELIQQASGATTLPS